MTPHEKSQKVLHRIIKHFPNLRWIHVISLSGFTVSAVGGIYNDISKILQSGEIENIEDIKSDNALIQEESPIAPMSTASFSIIERITQELRMGKGKYAIIAGEKTTLIIMPISFEYCLSIGIRATASFAEVIQYFNESNALSELETIWNLR